MEGITAIVAFVILSVLALAVAWNTNTWVIVLSVIPSFVLGMGPVMAMASTLGILVVGRVIVQGLDFTEPIVDSDSMD